MLPQIVIERVQWYYESGKKKNQTIHTKKFLFCIFKHIMLIVGKMYLKIPILILIPNVLWLIKKKKKCGRYY